MIQLDESAAVLAQDEYPIGAFPDAPFHPAEQHGEPASGDALRPGRKRLRAEERLAYRRGVVNEDERYVLPRRREPPRDGRLVREEDLEVVAPLREPPCREHV